MVNRLDPGRLVVDTMPRNIQAAALHPGHFNSTVGHTINKFPEYKVQGYGGVQKNEFNERKKWNQYIAEKRNGKHFKSTCHPKAVINPDNQFYKLPDALNTSAASATSVPRGKKEPVPGESERKPFKPSNPMKAGEEGYISRFMRLEPKPLPEGAASHKKKATSAEKEERRAFKYGTLTQTVSQLPDEAHSFDHTAHVEHQKLAGTILEVIYSRLSQTKLMIPFILRSRLIRFMFFSKSSSGIRQTASL